MDRTTTAQAIEWVRAHPGAKEADAKSAGISKTTFYKARRGVVALVPPPAAAPPHPPSPLPPSSPPTAEAKADATADAKGKIERCIAWYRARPESTWSAETCAAAVGCSKATALLARQRLGGVFGRPRAAQALLSARASTRPSTPPADAILELVRRLRDECGVEELHLRDGRLEIRSRWDLEVF